MPNISYVQEHVEQALVRADLVKPGFFNSWALNLYHDGSEGIQSHYDDPDRFEQPSTACASSQTPACPSAPSCMGEPPNGVFTTSPMGLWRVIS